VTRLELARAEIARRRALVEGATTGPWKGTRLRRLGGRTAVVVATVQHGPASRGAFVLADSDPEARFEDAHFIAVNDPAHVLRVLAAADAALDRHARTHVCQGRWLDDAEAAVGDTVGRYVWPHLVCAEAQAVLDLYAPQEAS
jgi:hypothetical protein